MQPVGPRRFLCRPGHEPSPSIELEQIAVAHRKKIKIEAAQQTCESAVSLIGDYLSGSLAPGIRFAFEHHLGECRDCEAFLNTYKKTIELTQRFLKAQGRGKRSGKLRLQTRPMRLATK
jgi:hypothetical protein